MAVTFEQVKAALDPEEPAYNKSAAALGAEALPHLARLVAGDQTMLASKAAYLAGLIGTPEAVDVVQRAARSTHASVRVAAAAAAGKLPSTDADDVLINLIDDGDLGVQKIALRAISADGASEALRARVRSLSTVKGKVPNQDLARETMARIGGSADMTDATDAAPNRTVRKKSVKQAVKKSVKKTVKQAVKKSAGKAARKSVKKAAKRKPG